MAEDVFEIDIQAGQPVYRQIIDNFRKKIQSEAFVPGTRLPTISKLAKKWNTNYFTVQTAFATLANEGLIESAPRSGTRIRGSQIRCTSIGIYFGSHFHKSNSDGFYSMLFGILCDQLSELNIRSSFWIDHRPLLERDTPLPALEKAIDKREVQGLITSMTGPGHYRWLKDVAVPLAICGELDSPFIVTNDKHQMAIVTLRRFRELGCKTVGLLSNDPGLARIFEQEAKKLRLKTSKEWIRLSPTSDVVEIEGATLFKQLWSQDTHPDGLFIFPDVLAPGALMSILEKQIRVPEDLHVISHLNAELDFYCPLKVEWIVSHITRIAEALITSIQNQVSGKRPSQVLIPLEMRSITSLETVRMR